MKFKCYTDWEQVPESANVLFAASANDSLFFSRPWFENVAASLDDETMALACVLDENKVMAILPLMKSEGYTGYALKHRYTSLYSLLLLTEHNQREVQSEVQQQILTCLVAGLSQLPTRAFLLEPVSDEDNNLAHLQAAMEAAGFSCDRVFRFYNWFLRVQGQSYADYMAARPARLRNTILRKQRKLEREHGYDIRLFSGSEVEQKMPDYYAVYSASWKANEQYADFVNAMVARFSQAGWSRLAILYIKEQPIAAQLWFVHHGKASIFRLAYDKVWKSYSPGSIVTSFLMAYVIDVEQVEEIDFLTGNDAYKQDWMSDRRERFALSCVKKVKPTGWVERFIKALKRLLKRT